MTKRNSGAQIVTSDRSLFFLLDKAGFFHSKQFLVNKINGPKGLTSNKIIG